MYHYGGQLPPLTNTPPIGGLSSSSSLSLGKSSPLGRLSPIRSPLSFGNSSPHSSTSSLPSIRSSPQVVDNTSGLSEVLRTLTPAEGTCQRFQLDRLSTKMETKDVNSSIHYDGSLCDGEKSIQEFLDLFPEDEGPPHEVDTI